MARPTRDPSLADLRAEIDRIDAAMHALLMERGEIIDRLIKVKGTAGIRLGVPPGARSRHDAPAGRAPSRHSAARYRREHLARHHRDLHLRAGAVLACMPTCRRATRRCATARGFISASPCRSSRIWARPASSRRSPHRKGDLGLVPATRRAGPPAWWTALEGDGAEDHRAAAVRRARRSSGRAAGVRDRAAAADAMVTDVEMWSIRVAGWSAEAAQGACRGDRCGRGAGPRASTARRCWSRCRRR